MVRSASSVWNVSETVLQTRYKKWNHLTCVSVSRGQVFFISVRYSFKIGGQFFRCNLKTMMEPPLHGFYIGAAVIIHVVVFRYFHIRSMAAEAVTADQKLKVGIKSTSADVGLIDDVEGRSVWT